MAFSKHFTPDNEPTVSEDPILEQVDELVPNFAEFMKRYSGVSFNNGLYRVHAVNAIRLFTALCVEAFPAFEGRIVCFSSDWLGRQFSIDLAGRDKKLVHLMDSGANESFEIPHEFREFHNDELVQDKEAALAESFYKKWLDQGGRPPDLSECVGYRVPLFLNGEDDTGNLEVIDMEVYWSINAQLIAQIEGRSEQ